MEDKGKICSFLSMVLRSTQEYCYLIGLIYDEVEEVVIAIFPDREIEINVAMDSGIAMVRDILNTLQELY